MANLLVIAVVVDVSAGVVLWCRAVVVGGQLNWPGPPVKETAGDRDLFVFSLILSHSLGIQPCVCCADIYLAAAASCVVNQFKVRVCGPVVPSVSGCFELDTERIMLQVALLLLGSEGASMQVRKTRIISKY
jgi:hypothetical protein